MQRKNEGKVMTISLPNGIGRDAAKAFHSLLVECDAMIKMKENKLSLALHFFTAESHCQVFHVLTQPQFESADAPEIFETRQLAIRRVLVWDMIRPTRVFFYLYYVPLVLFPKLREAVLFSPWGLGV